MIAEIITRGGVVAVLNNVGLAELILTGCWYIWWERRQSYAYEVQLMEAGARTEAARVANEERKAAKVAERRAFKQDFRQALVERAEKLEKVAVKR
ncbi:hypothetical protein PR202_gb14006 [Eleusine coracana subsp. coracana]|uniref:Uncharacterized protein n=1 Tax=Eleusine coracana subsp. coracana TaxID=191504 RepID=A0AAV5ETH7_ELECO|nr:hypothetical protein PR202_gb14006 [Eleusine coracana subsp. coracana]